ncbi:MAG: hypothetical protein WCX46_02420 [Candidatus Paceibacterota bacterium]
MNNPKAGQRVILKKYIYKDRPSNPLWGGIYGKIKGTIIRFLESSEIEVKWDNKIKNTYFLSDLTLIESTHQSTHKIINIGQEFNIKQ